MDYRHKPPHRGVNFGRRSGVNIQRRLTPGMETVIVAGKLRKWKGQLLDVDPPNLRRQLEASRDYVFAAAGVPQDLFSSQ